MHPVQTGIGVDADGDASTPAGTENIGTTVPTPSPPPCTRPHKSTQKPKGQGHPPQLAYAPPGEYRASTKTIRGEYSVPLGAMALPLVSHIGPGLNIVNISCEQTGLKRPSDPGHQTCAPSPTTSGCCARSVSSITEA